ncbi:MAG: methyltransferase domain-containing protein [Candidatus Yonathbacteria bacterium]|nr:methyltransferase domain-containing protein [Candidatus Yonathbacteria bacterium]
MAEALEVYCKGIRYPSYMKRGNACSYIMPFAVEFCKGRGLDIGGFDNSVFPGAQAINVVIPDKFDAYNLPAGKFDFIFSSHTLEHLPDYVRALMYWKEHLKEIDGVLFLYLPHPDMVCWLPQNNKKHFHMFYPKDMERLLLDLGFVDVIVSERDLYWSFCAVAFTRNNGWCQ